MTPEDLRSAVAAGILDEAQAARLSALVQEREGRRARMPSEDEPFEFFRGFSEIFISIGLVILLTGVTSLLVIMSFAGSGGEDGGTGFALLICAVTAAICWWMAGYFTLKRRMTLPSMVLATAFGIALLIFAFALMERVGGGFRLVGTAGFGLASVGMVLWYLRFKLPFSAFLTGLFMLGLIYAFVLELIFREAALLGSLSAMATGLGGGMMLDLGSNPVLSTATLVFGIGAFVVGMWFDIRDPHRLGRHAATAFWCHLLAAPALVNTVAVTLMAGGGIGKLSVALLVITLLALVIDRRSFLTAGIAYIAIVLAWLVGEGGGLSFVFVILVLGALITAIGTWWVQLRAFVMTRLPDFPGKGRLPPYSMPE